MSFSIILKIQTTVLWGNLLKNTNPMVLILSIKFSMFIHTHFWNDNVYFKIQTGTLYRLYAMLDRTKPTHDTV